MLNYQQTVNIINIIKDDINIHNKNPKQAKLAYQAIYNYLNHAGGHTPIPNELKGYTNTLAIFQNPYEILASLRKNCPSNMYFDDKVISQEIKTIVLLWLQEATTNTANNIDLQNIISQYNAIH